MTSVPATHREITRLGLNGQVYAIVRERLVSSAVRPGERLTAVSLAASLGVSRSPVAHALTRLATEGLLEVEPHRGYFVRPLTMTIISEAYDVRLALELYAGQRLISDSTAFRFDFASIRDAMNRRLHTVRDGHILDINLFIQTNEEFHNHIIDAVGNHTLSLVYRNLSINLLMHRVMREMVHAGEDVNGEHEQIVNAIREKDLESYRSACSRHVESGKRMAKRAIDRAGGAL